MLGSFIVKYFVKKEPLGVMCVSIWAATFYFFMLLHFASAISGHMTKHSQWLIASLSNQYRPVPCNFLAGTQRTQHTLIKEYIP